GGRVDLGLDTSHEPSDLVVEPDLAAREPTLGGVAADLAPTCRAAGDEVVRRVRSEPILGEGVAAGVHADVEAGPAERGIGHSIGRGCGSDVEVGGVGVSAEPNRRQPNCRKQLPHDTPTTDAIPPPILANGLAALCSGRATPWKNLRRRHSVGGRANIATTA